MNRNLIMVILVGLIICLFSGQALAAEESETGDKTKFYVVMAISMISGMAVASSVCGFAQSLAIRSAMDAVSRQPSAAKDLQTMLIIGLALIEALGLYTLVVALVFIFTVNPF